jgi:hypothetical protein
MRRTVQGLAAVAVVGLFVWLAACGSSPTGPKSVSLAGSYALTGFVLGGANQPFTSGALTLTDSAYAVDIVFPAESQFPEIVDSGSYTATDSGAFSETSRLTGMQISGTYTSVNNVLTVTATEQGVPVTQTWQKH